MDTPFYNDLRSPFMVGSQAAVTLAATAKALYLPAAHPKLGGNYWWVGKKVMLEIAGRFTSAATPGNFTINIYWGTGADANGTVLATSAATAWTASQSNMTWRAQFIVTCTAIGASGALKAIGSFKANEAAIAAELMIPATSPAAVTVDTTSDSVLSVQALRSGSTAETMQVDDFNFIALN